MQSHIRITLETLMDAALVEAHAALAIEEVPIGCVIYHRGMNQIIGRGHNRRIVDQDPTAHAEIIAIRQAARVIGDWRLTGCVLAVTLEPCPMCAGAIVNARIPEVIYGCDDPKAGAVRTLYQLCESDQLNHRAHVTPGVQSEACATILRDFFRKQRAMGKK